MCDGYNCYVVNLSRLLVSFFLIHPLLFRLQGLDRRRLRPPRPVAKDPNQFVLLLRRSRTAGWRCFPCSGFSCDWRGAGGELVRSLEWPVREQLADRAPGASPQPLSLIRRHFLSSQRCRIFSRECTEVDWVSMFPVSPCFEVGPWPSCTREAFCFKLKLSVDVVNA
jgi:hypothetical protein